MTEGIIPFLLDESKWITISLFLSLLAVIGLGYQKNRRNLDQRIRILERLNFFTGFFIGSMSFGHLLAVTIRFFQGTLESSLWILYPIGFVLAVPSWYLIFNTRRLLEDEKYGRTRISNINVGLVIILLSIGLHNWLLAFPPALTTAYLFNSRRVVGWIIVTIEIVTILLMFVLSLMFFISGQNFEQFR